MKAYWEVQAGLHSFVTSHCMQVRSYTPWPIFPQEKSPRPFSTGGLVDGLEKRRSLASIIHSSAVQALA
jgi:hypothetical protein